MRFVVAVLASLASFVGCVSTRPAAAQELARVSVSRPLRVAGIVMEAGQQDLIGLSRIKFQGLIAAELGSVGYRLANLDDSRPVDASSPPLTLIGSVKEEVCDDQTPTECRAAIQWELQDPRGVVVYRTITRAVQQAVSLEQMRRGLVDGALRSLLQRRRFTLQLSDESKPTPQDVVDPLGFKQCRRPPLVLPEAARAALASLVFVESGSNLQAGAIISGDGLILTAARLLERDAPLRVRFSAEQTLAAKVVAQDRAADVALVRVDAHTETTCLALGDRRLPAGQAVFGIASELAEDRALSIAGGVLQPAQAGDGAQTLRIDPLLARAPGGALLDAQGRLVGIVPEKAGQSQLGARALDVQAALTALRVKPAAITDPRLLDEPAAPARAVGFVRDHDDPPFALSKRYTFGTSRTAHRLRTASLVTAGVGVVAVGGTWVGFRSARELSPSAHDRLVVLNDLGWVLLGLGAVGVGVSYALPEGHDVVGVRNANAGAKRVFVALGPGGIALGGRL